MKKMMRMLNNKILVLAAFVGAISLASCKPNKGEPPIGKHEMAMLLADVHVAQSLLNNQTTIPADKLERNRYYKSVLDKHNVSEAVFDSAITWYSSNLTEYKQVYVELIDTLNHRRVRM